MIKIETTYKKGAKNYVDMKCKIVGYSDEITNELAAILKCLYDKFPDLFMDAIELHMKDCFDELERGGDND